MQGTSIIFINVTLKFCYKPIGSNNFIDETIWTKEGKVNEKMSLYVFLFLLGI